MLNSIEKEKAINRIREISLEFIEGEKDLATLEEF